MKFFLLFTSILFLCFPVYSRNRDNSLLSLNNATLYTIDKFPGGNSWLTLHGTATIDPVTLYQGEKSLRIMPDSLNRSDVSYTISAYALEGNNIRFSGKYKYTDAQESDISFSILQLTSEGVQRDSVVVNNCSGSSDWVDFEVESELKKAQVIYLAVNTRGSLSLNLSRCEFEIDGRTLDEVLDVKFKADEDHEFDDGSNIVLEAVTAQTIENLEILGKVWGFLKYYHPAVVKGNYNWDFELFRILPSIVNASSRKERNQLLCKWIDSYGRINEYGNIIIPDSAQYSRFIKLNWLEDTDLFDNELIQRLEDIRKAKRSDRNNYYVISWLNTINKEDAFAYEKPYPDISWEDHGFRILTLFRFWNAMEYCYPYLDLTDTPWKLLLKEYLPYFIEVKNKTEYEQLIRKLIAGINDSHGGSYFPDSDLKNTVLAQLNYPYIVPAKLILSKEKHIVVETSNSQKLKRGDILLSINGKQIQAIIEEFRPYISASNEISFVNKVLQKIILKSENPSLKATILRKGKKLNVLLDAYTQEQFIPGKTSGIKSWKEYKLKSQGIAYIDVATMSGDSVVRIIRDNSHSKGLILDLRSYPASSSFQSLYSLLLPKEETFMWFSTNDKSMPGNFVLSGDTKIGTDNPDYFKGKIAILVNEGTQSHGEFSAIAYRKAPRSAIIGSTTAGADGNVALFKLPGDITVQYTGLGAYYPDWEVCQRAGVKIDIHVRPTVDEIRNGQDVLIEKAIEYIDK